MRIIALDVGDVRIGVAICDALEIGSYPLTTIHRVGSLKRDVAAVADIIAEQEADAVLVGMPLSLDGNIGTQAVKVQGFSRALANCVPVPLVFWDESLSSVDAEERLIAMGVSREKRRARIDETAASIILEGFLDHRRRSGASRDAI